MMIGTHLNNCSLAAGQALDPLSEANRYFKERNYQAAVNIYQRILATNLDVPTKAKAWFNLGMTYQKLARYDDAINAFTQIFNMDVNDREPGGNIMEPYRNYRSRAQWEVANSLFAKGDYKGALEAYQTTRLKYPLQSWCGVEKRTAQYAYALHEGLSYEYLGLYREAVDSYLRIYAPRLVNLYEAAGQLDDLKEIISRRDRVYVASLANQLSTPVSPEDLERYRPSQILHDLLEIHALGEAHDWPALFNQLHNWSKGGGDGRQAEVVRMISRYPKETVPLLKKELGRLSVPPDLMYEALGLAGTSDAVATLKNKAKKEENIWSAMSLVHALSVAGKPGQKALKELDKIATHNLRIAIDKYKSGELQEQYEKVRFPPIPSKLALPRDI
jgi:tetratricopeptide (TPR) repeat protein